MCGSIEVERPLYRFNRLVLRRPTPRNKSVLNESQPQSRPRTKLGGMTCVEQVREEEPNEAEEVRDEHVDDEECEMARR